MKMFNKKAYENIVENNTNQYQHEIAKQLNPSVQNGTRKYHMANQHKSCGEADHKRNDECGDMRFKRNKAKM
jgi:hypothetical protein